MGKGICVAGNMMVDILYPTAGWPRQGELVHILEGIERSVGGAVHNVLVDLAVLDPTLELYALGRNGADDNGRIIMDRLAAHPSIDTSGILLEGDAAFTAVMSDTLTKQRTFFTYLGANARFDEDSIDWDRVGGDILHVGYILLLNALDQPDGEYGSKMARLLHHARQRGFRTSIDVVSEAGERFARLVPPALRYADYCVINEVEAQQTTGVALRDGDGALLKRNLPQALESMRRMGVAEWAVIHCPEGAAGMDRAGRYLWRNSLRLPEGWIQGTVGAGDAFCAGVLYGAEKDWSLEKAIDLGAAMAAASLSRPGSTEGMLPLEDTMALVERFGGRE